MIRKYNQFINDSLDKEFESITYDIFLISESGEWLDDKTYEWDLKKKNRLESFLSKLSKDRIREYFIKLVNMIKPLSKKIRTFLIRNYLITFLSFTTLTYLLSGNLLSNDIKGEIIELTGAKSSFEDAQKLVKSVESGYSDDRGDTGNWIDVIGGKRFVGTNHGISAPILKDYMNKLPKKEDMKNLSYETAVKIYKKKYWDKQNLMLLSNQSIANILYDGCVNQGINGMKDVFRKSLVDNDIEIGDGENPFSNEFIEKANLVNPETLFNSIKEYRELRYKEAATFDRHGKGWLLRLSNINYL